MKKNWHIIILSVIFSIILWISISLSYDYYATVNVPINLSNFPPGYSTASKIPKDVSVKLKGKGWKLLGVNLTTKSDYNISVDDSGRISVNLYNYLSENQWLTSDIDVIDISPDTLSFYVEKDFMKKVSIIPDLDLNYKSGYGLATPIKIYPDSTTVYGPKSVVKNLTFVYTKRKSFKNLDNKSIEIVPLEDLPGVIYQNKEVNVDLNIQKIVDKTFEDVNVQVIDLPVDRDVVLLPNKISVSVKAGIEILGKMSRDNIKAFVNYREVVLDTLGSIVPQINLPNNTSLEYIKPDRLRYIIKKF
jgi:YbbR domain-containing protein